MLFAKAFERGEAHVGTSAELNSGVWLAAALPMNFRTRRQTRNGGLQLIDAGVHFAIECVEAWLRLATLVVLVRPL